MSLFDRWRARSDDARRTKGDPPPTVDQLLILTRQQGEINRNLRSQVDGLNAVNKELRTALAEKSEYIGQLALELAQVKADGICGDEAPTMIGCTSMHSVCVLRHGHASEWHEAEYGQPRWRKAKARVTAMPQLALDPTVDGDPGRPYTRDYDPEATP